MKGRQGPQGMFGDRIGGARVQAELTKVGAALFERKRRQLATLAKRLRGWTFPVSDAATIEYLVRGELPTQHYLGQFKKEP